ncbi:MAG: substrate-binding domain-containing protein [Candidatus Dormibacteraeota bacterium]|nr:substrate-binding domain-containing protein [Candidatus Dormibacteraeota bacterium]
MRKVHIVVAAAVAAVAAGAATLGPAGASGGGGPTAQLIIGSGSDTTQRMMSDLSALYQFSPGCDQIPTAGVTPQPTPAANPWLDFSCQNPDHYTQSGSGTSTSGSNKVTFSGGVPAGVTLGEQVQGPGITAATWPKGVYVGNITLPNQISLSSSPDGNNAVFADGSAGSGTFIFSTVVRTENYEHDQMDSAYFLGSGNGLSQLCTQGTAGVAHIDYARSSSTPSSSNCTGLRAVNYALDGISWEAFAVSGGGVVGQSNASSPCVAPPSGPKYCLTLAQLQNIFVNCTVTNWNQVGGANVPIHPYTPQAGSGTRKTFDKFLSGNSETCIDKQPAPYPAQHVIPENANNAILAVGDQADAIFPFSFGIWNTQVKGFNSAVLGAVNNIQPTVTTIANGTFPFTRQLWNVYCSPTTPKSTDCKQVTNQQTVNFVGEEGWLCNASTGVTGSKTLTGHIKNPYSPTGNNFFGDIQGTIKNDGFVPLTFGAIGGGDTNKDYCRLLTT